MRDIDSSCRFGALLQVPHFDLLCFVCLYSKIALPLLYLAGQKKARTTKFSSQTRTLPVNLTGDHSRHLELEYTGDQILLFSQIKCLTAQGAGRDLEEMRA